MDLFKELHKVFRSNNFEYLLFKLVALRVKFILGLNSIVMTIHGRMRMQHFYCLLFIVAVFCSLRANAQSDQWDIWVTGADYSTGSNACSSSPQCDDANVSTYDYCDGIWCFNANGHGLPSNNINVVKKNTNGQYWIGTDNGIAVYDSTNWGGFHPQFTGLEGRQVSDIEFGSGDTVWISTIADGIAMFDGIDWVNFNAQNSNLSDNWAEALLVDVLGDLWVGTKDSGLFQFDGSSWTNYQMSNSPIVDNYIADITQAQNGDYWISTVNGGISVFDGSFGWSLFNSGNSPIAGNNVTEITFDADTAWVATFNEGLLKFDTATGWTIYDNTSTGGILPSNSITSVSLSPSGTKWVGTLFGGLASFNNSSWQAWHSSSSGLSDDWVKNIHSDNGGVWLATSYGLSRYNSVVWDNLNLSQAGIAFNYVQAIASDNSGNIWVVSSRDDQTVASANEGISRFQAGSWNHFDTTNSNMISNYVRDMDFESDGTAWLAGDSSGVESFDGATWQQFTSANGLPSNNVLSIYVDTNDHVWAGTDQGIGYYDQASWASFTSAQTGLQSDRITSISSTADGRLVVASFGGFAIFDGNNWVAYHASNSALINDTIVEIKGLPNGNIWMATASAGLVSFSGDSAWNLYNTSNSSINNNSISSLAFDQFNRLWAGSDSGLVTFNGVDWNAFNTANSSLPNNKVLGLSIDTIGDLWVGTAFGLARFTPDSSSLVWPGDANFDGLATMVDILNIGLTYEFTGPTRTSASINWIGQDATDFSSTFKNGVNHKHADCDGSGVIDSLDVTALDLNYFDSHPKTFGARGDTSAPPLFFVLDADTVSTSDTLSGEIHFGTAANSVDSVYGMSFTINYDPGLIDTNSAIVSFDSNWLGYPDTTVELVKYFPNLGQIDVGICRINHTNTSGNGRLGHVSIVVIDNIDGKREAYADLAFTFSNVHIITYSESQVSVYSKTDSVLISGIIDQEVLLPNDIEVYPIPSEDVLNIRLVRNDVASISLFSLIGEETYSVDINGAKHVTVDCSNLQPGLFLLQFVTKSGETITQKALKAN